MDSPLKKPTTGIPRSEEATLIAKVSSLVDAGQATEALRVLGHVTRRTEVTYNAQGVCLMRLGRYSDAVEIYRSFVMEFGCTWMKATLPVFVRANFATALLLAGHTTGFQSTLAEIKEQSHPSVARLRQSLKDWERNLSWLGRLKWFCGVAPKTPITLTFPPGEFVESLVDLKSPT
ncbi:MAG: tetratricopeptide repeat protein [Planctomycetaceae bacterium]